ncbi:hypothetical protein GCM10009780_42350 [Actinomadura alba]
MYQRGVRPDVFVRVVFVRVDVKTSVNDILIVSVSRSGQRQWSEPGLPSGGRRHHASLPATNERRDETAREMGVHIGR